MVSKKEKFFEVLDFCTLTIIFSAGSFIGYIVEVLYCIVKKGFFESKQGMVYGPFNQIYGFGAMIMTVILVPLAMHKKWRAFLYGVFIGGAFEFSCSMLQELLFGTRSWDFSAKALNILGRTGFTYMLFWGLLTMLFVSYIYPLIIKLVFKIPKKLCTLCSCILMIFFIVNLLISGGAVIRWNQRQTDSKPAETFSQNFFDTYFPDERMKKIYPAMWSVEKD